MRRGVPWFDVFLHGIVSAMTVNLILYALVVSAAALARPAGVTPAARTATDTTHVELFIDGERGDDSVQEEHRTRSTPPQEAAPPCEWHVLDPDSRQTH